MSSLRSAILVPAIMMFFASAAVVAQGGGGFDAEATCSVTGAHGTAHGLPSGKAAIDAAIASCRASGGIAA